MTGKLEFRLRLTGYVLEVYTVGDATKTEVRPHHLSRKSLDTVQFLQCVNPKKGEGM
jgi:hypothetical protein